MRTTRSISRDIYRAFRAAMSCRILFSFLDDVFLFTRQLLFSAVITPIYDYTRMRLRDGDAEDMG